MRAPIAKQRCDIAIAAQLQHGLPPGSQVAVCWREPQGEPSRSISDGADTGLARLAERLLDASPDDSVLVDGVLVDGALDDSVLDDGMQFDSVRFDSVRFDGVQDDDASGHDATGRLPTGRSASLALAWELDAGIRASLAVQLAAPLPDGVGACWPSMARQVVAANVRALRAIACAESLTKSERLQQSLYEIADLAGSDLEMADMLRRIHRVVAGLMYAQNCYIALYDDAAESVRFLYFADERDPYVADPARAIPAAQLANSATLGLIRRGAPLQGPSQRICQQLGLELDAGGQGQLEKDNGPDSQDWLGVPMRRDERVCGAIVVQSYDQCDVYGEEELALLVFVAQHILTALDRRQARQELERRVEERTKALQLSNRDLQGEIVERQRAERLQRALFRIAELSITSDTLERFYSQVHDVVGELLYARNFYIALLSDDGQQLEFPYSIDERDGVRPTRALASGLTEYVIARGQALMADRTRIDALREMGAARSLGALAHCWLGVPLFRDEVVVGVIAVQSYSPAVVFSDRDRELLTFVAHHIGIGLARKQAQDRLVTAHGELEQRVTARTHELAEANAELLAQIGERLRAEQQLTHQARHDALTGLPNRNQLLDRLEAAIRRAQRDPSQVFAVLFLDLDRFKLVNDSAGHAAGDDLLVEAGRRIVDSVRGGDTVARLGGDEFAILAEPIDGAEMAQALAEQILRALGEPCWVAGREVFPAGSIGIALWNPRYRDGAELLRDADAAMYRAKAGGRDRSAIFDEEMREDAMRILDLEADLRRSINGDGFVAFYQPIVSLADGSVVGHEALLRWRHERRGLLMPGEFIGLGADSGLIEEVDWLVYRQVVERLARGGQGYISVNVSPRHFRAADFADRLLRLIDDAGADPHRLRIEITEVALLDDVPRALRMLRSLRSHGVLAQLDDFGTGFSALSYLHRFPIECLKIDQSFVAGLVGDTRPESVAVVRAIQALAGTLGIHTIGEGIEGEAQRAALQGLGCGYGQGYYFGRPAPEPVFHPALAMEHRRSGVGSPV